MNLLLIGFSEQNATAIKVLCKRNFQSIRSFSIPRQFSAQMSLMLPRRHQIMVAADAFMIDLEGVGMTQHSIKAQSELISFITAKPAVLVSRRDLSDWKVLEQQLSTPTFYLSSPYSVDDMHDMLQSLKSSHMKSARLRTQDTDLNTASITQSAPVLTSSRTESNATATRTSANHTAIVQAVDKQENDRLHISDADNNNHNEPLNTTSAVDDESSIRSINSHASISNNRRSSFATPPKTSVAKQNQPNVQVLDVVLQQYFAAIYDTVCVQTVLAVFAKKQPLILQVDKYELLIHPVERSVIMDTEIARVVDYFCIVGTHQYALSTTDRIKVIPITGTQYTQKSQQLHISGHKKYALSTIFWQLAAEVGFKEIPSVVSHLQLKIKYVPNFAMMRFVPAYVYPVLAACLNKVRTLAELQALFPELSLQQLNHIVLLCILSGVADELVLTDAPIQATNSSQKKVDEKYINTDIRQANRTGFFKRLLQKLSI